jgi:hypothetical protein
MAKNSVRESGPQAFNDSGRKDNASLAMITTILQERRLRNVAENVLRVRCWAG